MTKFWGNLSRNQQIVVAIIGAFATIVAAFIAAGTFNPSPSPSCQISASEISIERSIIEVNQTTRVSVRADNPDGRILLYNWQTVSGNINPNTRSNSPEAVYTAPSNPVDDTVSVDITLENCQPVRRSRSVSVILSSPSPTPTPTDAPTSSQPTNTPTSELTNTPTPKPTNTPTNIPTPSTDTPPPTLTNTSTFNTPTYTPSGTATPIPPLSSIPTVAIPLYDDFEDGILDTDKWGPPPWDKNNKFRPVEADGFLRFETNGIQLANWAIQQEQPVQEMSALITLERANIWAFGITIMGNDREHPRYDFFMISTQQVVIDTGETTLKVIDVDETCCPGTHLLGIESDLNQIHFYIDNNLVASFPMKGFLTYAGFQIGRHNWDTVGYVSDVWVKFLE